MCLLQYKHHISRAPERANRTNRAPRLTVDEVAVSTRESGAGEHSQTITTAMAIATVLGVPLEKVFSIRIRTRDAL